LNKNDLKIREKLLDIFPNLEIKYQKAVLGFAELALSSQNSDITENEFDKISEKCIK